MNNTNHGTVEISKALIGCVGVVLAAIITGIFLLISNGVIRVDGLPAPSPSATRPTGSIPQVTPHPPVSQPTTSPVLSQPLCYGNCWQYDNNARTMTWTGQADGIEDIWQPAGEALQKIREGYTAIFNTSVPGEIFACILTINGEAVKTSCDGVLYQLPLGTYRVTSANRDIGGFRWCPMRGIGWRADGGECK
jgi:hypothetical protein